MRLKHSIYRIVLNDFRLNFQVMMFILQWVHNKKRAHKDIENAFSPKGEVYG